MAKKRKQTAKQRAASLRNLAKARRAQRSKHHGRTKSPRKRARSAREVPASRAMVLHKDSRRGRKQTRKQRAASLRNLRKARAAQRRPSSKPRKRAKSSGRRKGQTPKQRAASLRNLRKARSARRRGSSKPRRKTTRSASRRSAPRRRKSGRTAAQHRASLRNLRKARSARKRAKKRHPVRGYSYHRPPKRVHVASHLSWESGEYAMENPMGGVEIFVAFFTGLLGFLTADLVDRVLATHPLTDKGAKDTAGHELYADNPPTASTWKGNYVGLFNPTAIAAPMSIARWGFGLGIAVVPVVIAKWVEAPVGRSALQLFGFGALMRVVGKGAIDLIAMVSKWTTFGQRFYDGELRAAALQSGDGSEASLPSAGLGGAPGLGCDCTNCTQGVGACCGTGKAYPGAQEGAVGTGKPADAGTGYPSMPREVAPPEGNFVPPPPPPPPAPALNQGGSGNMAPLQGVGADVFAVKKNPYDWGREAA